MNFSVYRRPYRSVRYIAEGSDFDNQVGADRLWVDEGFLEILEVRIIEGRSFPEDPPDNSPYLIMINETLKHELGWEEPLGKTLDFRREPDGEPEVAQIIGVVEDINWGPARMACKSMVLEYAQDWASYVMVKTPGDNITGALAELEAKFS